MLTHKWNQSPAAELAVLGGCGDRVGAHWATAATAIVALAIYPLAFALAPHLAEARDKERSYPDNSPHRSGIAST